jgi:hypothetical protein
MVLAIMFVALCYQVFKVWNPEPPPPPPVHRTATTDVEGAVEIPEPPPVGRPWEGEDTNELRKNPFTRMTGSVTTSEGSDEKIQLLKIIVWSDGSLRAELKTPQEKGYFQEGEAFSTYEVLSIDKEAGTVEVFSAETNKRLTLSVEK